MAVIINDLKEKYFIPSVAAISLIFSSLYSTQTIAGEGITKALGAHYSFSNVSVNYLDWTSGTEERSGKGDFVYLEIEGGAGWDWGEFYFFSDIENPGESWNGDLPDNRRFVIKPIADIKIGDSNWYFHVQDYYLKEDNFYVNNFVPGIAYKFSGENGSFIRPFLGPHLQNSTYYDGFNGYMAGWVAAYNFSFKGQSLTFSQWHENEFDRDDEHYKTNDDIRIGDGSKTGINGAVALWWNINKDLTTGIQYRYANDKLGAHTYQSGMIYTVKYNF